MTESRSFAGGVPPDLIYTPIDVTSLMIIIEQSGQVIPSVDLNLILWIKLLAGHYLSHIKLREGGQ